MLQIWPVPVLADNYVWILERQGSGRVAVVDPGDAEPVLAAIERRDLEISTILLTHHHGDHVGGVAELSRRFQPAVVGPLRERIDGVTRSATEGDRIELDDLEVTLTAIDVPGHTAGHMAYLAPDFALVGDTLFAGGCGRVFEGTPEQMHGSLSRLGALSPAIAVYCAHEYTVANLRFARAVEPANVAVADRLAAAEELRAAAQPTVPSRLADELATNPFLRCSQPAIVAAAEARTGRTLSPGAEIFAVIRTWKDGFAG